MTLGKMPFSDFQITNDSDGEIIAVVEATSASHALAKSFLSPEIEDDTYTAVQIEAVDHFTSDTTEGYTEDQLARANAVVNGAIARGNCPMPRQDGVGGYTGDEQYARECAQALIQLDQ